jgi:hypothetical protein
MQPPPEPRDEWIMLCLDHKLSPLMTLHHIQFPAAPSTTELFQCLAKEHEERREPYTLLTIKIRPFWRKVKAIHFVRFTTLGPQPTVTTQIEDMHSLPHEAYNWVWNRRNGINASTMARYLQELSSTGEGWSVYEYSPKTRHLDPLSRRSVTGEWGLYVEEGVSGRSKVLGVIVLLTIVYLWVTL